ncbi:DUF4382 domain-containing protein [Rapidithrix thailandica]|uniref:DUF4382 domain-containing protein n=1 Tax=Rapidithrix thailandica TaxID=413964 RepID=A0AAW9SD54_9BACT
MKTRIKLIFQAVMLLGILSLTACNNDDEVSTARFQVKLTDAPADYDEVNVDIQGIRINTTDGEEGWVDLDGVHTGVYNLLDFTAGSDTLLADVILPVGTVHQLRLVVGDNNSLKIGDDILPLKTPSGQQSGLKLNIDAELKEGITYTLILDFDAARSVVKAGNSGKYNLKPVIRATAEANSGSIKGWIVPLEADATVLAIQGTDTLGTYPDAMGNFLFRGVKPGTYQVNIIPENLFDYDEVVIEDVHVKTGEVSNLGEISVEAD